MEEYISKLRKEYPYIKYSTEYLNCPLQENNQQNKKDSWKKRIRNSLMIKCKQKENEKYENDRKKQELISTKMRQINIVQDANKDRAWKGSNKLTKIALKNKKIKDDL